MPPQRKTLLVDLSTQNQNHYNQDRAGDFVAEEMFQHFKVPDGNVVAGNLRADNFAVMPHFVVSSGVQQTFISHTARPCEFGPRLTVSQMLRMGGQGPERLFAAVVAAGNSGQPVVELPIFFSKAGYCSRMEQAQITEIDQNDTLSYHYRHLSFHLNHQHQRTIAACGNVTSGVAIERQQRVAAHLLLVSVLQLFMSGYPQVAQQRKTHKDTDNFLVTVYAP
jgi:hypothetical protein